jgi:hypothetical protein
MRRSNEAKAVAERLTEDHWNMLAEVRRHSTQFFGKEHDILFEEGVLYRDGLRYFLTEFGKDVWNVVL